MSKRLKQNEVSGQSQKEFDKIIKAMLKVPPPKNWKDTKKD
jgi:hypothetical protein